MAKFDFNANDRDSLNLSVPLQKIDSERRLVSGFASLDNKDRQGDIIPADVAQRAFADFLGNIRLMHQPIAVGKMVDFKNDIYLDEDGNMYNGVYVTVYVSKGAEDAWQMVLDGTLTGFSIGALMKDSETVLFPDGGMSRIIKDMELVELSLVDSPANQYAKILEIAKVDGQVEIKGVAAEAKVQNVFYCSKDEILIPSEESAKSCIQCSDDMENIGWIENVGVKEDKESIIKMLTEYRASESKGLEIEKNEGGNTMENETVESEVVEKNDSVDEVSEEVVEKAVDAAEVSEEVVEDGSEEVVEKAEALDEEEETLEKSNEAPPELVQEVKNALTEALATYAQAQTEAVRKAFEDFSNSSDTKYESLKKEILDSVAAVEQRVSGLEGKTAIKKSAELGGKAEKLEKNESVWNGSAFGVPNKRFFNSDSIVN